MSWISGSGGGYAVAGPGDPNAPVAQPVVSFNSGPVNVRQYNAVGNDLTDDAPAIQNLINSLPPKGSGFRTGGTLFLPNGSYRIGSQLVLPEGVRLLGESTEATRIIATAGFSAGTSMITNQHTDGTQEAAYVETMTIHGNSAGGATCGDGIFFSGLFVNTAIRHVETTRCSGNGIHITMTPASLGSGPVFLEDINSFSNGLDLILIEKGFQSIMLEDITMESPAAGHHCLHIIGGAGVNGQNGRRVNMRNLYVETANANTASVLIENTSSVLLDGLFQGGVPAAGQAAIRLTGANNYLTGTRGIDLRSIWTLFSTGAVLIDDQVRSQQVLNETSPGYCDRYYSETAIKRTSPLVPNSSVVFANPFPFNCTVYITAGAGGPCTVQTSGGTTFAVIPTSGICAIDWPAGVSYQLVYASLPTWNWMTR